MNTAASAIAERENVWREIAEWDWVWYRAQDGEEGADDLLHAVASTSNDCDEDWYGLGATECGLTGELTIPGMFSRMSASRCPRCCDVVGMPHGQQSPKNVNECRGFAVARIDALSASSSAGATADHTSRCARPRPRTRRL